MATNPSGVDGALYDQTASNGLGALNTGIGFGINAKYKPLPAGIEEDDVPVATRIGLAAGVAGTVSPCGFAGKDVAVKTATGAVADGAEIETGWENQSGKALVAGDSVLAVEA